LKFLLDVNVGTTVAAAIAGEGHDVVRVALLAPRAEDRDILRWAVEQGRILVSCDSDFTDLIYGDGAFPPPGVIYIRYEPAEIEDLVPRILPLLDAETLGGHIIVVGRDETRRRPFPGKASEDA
jgi:predicted nuclease of predicted toxin-antitoxin system